MVLTRYKWILLLPLIGAFCVSPLGADEGDAAPVVVKVNVSLDGKLLEDGRIFFHLPKDQFVGAKIKSGKCTLDCVPAGTCKVTVESEGVPPKYSSLEQAALVVAVKPGKNAFDFALTSK